ncbi:DUF4097 family beta strand repeat-containing protein [Janibacter sp. GXQ6167]|uniref:DUF4097 family beta strand repeat-containing protein n=1 Tax=Janibacter sp. GXQ6167 TaxID=3240791 RepID=UPI0035248573
MKLAIKLASGALTLGLVLFAALGLAGGMFERTTEQTFPIDRAVTKIVLDNSVGTITVRAPRDGETYGLHSTSLWSIGGPKHAVKTEDGVLRATSGCRTSNSIIDRCRTKWTVIAPPGAQLSLANDVGEVSIDGVDNPVTARTDVGSVRLTDVTSTRIDASTDVGEVAIDAAEPPDAIIARAGVGSVDVTVPRGPTYRVELSATDSASQPNVATDLQSAHLIRVNADLGDAKVRYR